MLLRGRTALVTAGSRGIGAGVSRALARQGAAVAVNYHANADAAAEVVAAVEQSGSRGQAFAADVTDDTAVATMVERIGEDLGPVDLLVANAIGDTRSVVAGVGVPVLDSAEAIVAATSSQIRCVLTVCRHVVPMMRDAGGGSIVLIGGGATHASSFPTGLPAISVAKQAMDALAHLLATELGPDGIRVNVVGPGFVATDANAGERQQAMLESASARAVMGVVPTADQVGDTVAAVASDLFARSTGGFTVVDGGVTMI